MGYVGSHLWQLRQTWGTKLLIIPGVNAVVVNAKGDVLMGWREDLQGGCWATPGGAMEPGQSVVEALRAEILEELGQEVAEARFFGVLSQKASIHTYANGDELHPVSNLFEVRLAGEPENREEHTELSWFALNDLPKELLPETLAIMTMYKTWKATGAVQID